MKSPLRSIILPSLCVAFLVPGSRSLAGELILEDTFNAPNINNFDNSDQTGRRSGLAAADVQLRSSRGDRVRARRAGQAARESLDELRAALSEASAAAEAGGAADPHAGWEDLDLPERLLEPAHDAASARRLREGMERVRSRVLRCAMRLERARRAALEQAASAELERARMADAHSLLDSPASEPD